MQLTYATNLGKNLSPLHLEQQLITRHFILCITYRTLLTHYVCNCFYEKITRDYIKMNTGQGGQWGGVGLSYLHSICMKMYGSGILGQNPCALLGHDPVE